MGSGRTAFDLQGSDLKGLRIPFSRWRGANFSDTVLRHADCHGADLAQADFSRSDLTAANFRDADLRGASVRGAILSRTLTDGRLPDQDLGSGSDGG